MADIITTVNKVEVVESKTDGTTPFTIRDLRRIVKAAATFPDNSPVAFAVKGQVFQPDMMSVTLSTPIPPEVPATLPS